MHAEPLSNLISNIGCIEFGLLSAEEIRARSVLEVDSSELSEKNGDPKKTGLISRSLGAISREVRCETCKEVGARCMGHEGHIELARPVINPLFRETLRKLLLKYCRNCNRLNPIKATTSRRRECKYCKLSTLPKLSYTRYPFELKDQINGTFLSPEDVYELLSSISREVVVRDWGLKIRPIDLMFKAFLIPAHSVRPIIKLDNQLYNDDLTAKLQTIIEVNNGLKKILKIISENPESGVLFEKNLKSRYDLLAYHVYTYIDNKIPGLPIATHRGGKPISALLPRIESKEGYFRQNLSAKRTDYSSRNVLSPYGNIGLDEIGISIDHARKMTIPVLVTADTLEEYAANIRENREYPRVFRKETVNSAGQKVVFRIGDMNREEMAQTLKPGDILHRNLCTGDIVVLNRQPTLHEYGMMVHRVVVVRSPLGAETCTVRINSLIAGPYNADFDGDEVLNMCISNLSATEEAKLTMGVPYKMIDNKNDAPLIGVVREKLGAAHICTSKPFKLNRAQIITILGAEARNHVIPDECDSREIFSFVFPKGYNFEEKGTANPIRIVDGKLVNGVFSKKNVSKTSQLMIDLCCKLGSRHYFKFISFLLKVLERIEAIIGVTVSLANYKELFDQEKVTAIKERLRKLGPNEELVQKTLGEITAENITQFARRTRKVGTHTNFAEMYAISGASGSSTHLAQLISVGGPRTVKGYRPKEYFTQCYKPYLYNSFEGFMYAQGIVLGNYYKGLSHHDFINDCITARGGLVESNIKIRQIGYHSRKLSYSLNDLVADEQGMVRDADGGIVQLLFGDTGYNSGTYYSRTINDNYLGLFKDLPEGKTPEKVYDYLRSRGYANNIVATLRYHADYAGKYLDNASALHLAEELLTPVGAPVGMVCAHAIGERSGQMALDAKHAKEQKRGMKELFDLLDRVANKPQLVLSGPVEALRKFRQRYMIKKVNDLVTIKIDDNLERIVLTPHEADSQELVRSKIEAIRIPGIESVFANGSEIVIVIKESSQNYRDYYRLVSRLECIQVSGLTLAQDWKLNTTEGKLHVVGVTKTPALYRWFNAQSLPQGVKVTYQNIVYITKIYGIEVGRKAVYEELKSLIKQGLAVKEEYFSLISDLMTTKGELLAFNRSGLVARKAPLARCAFQSTKRVIQELVLSGSKDNLTNPISSVICGTPVSLGTGYFTLCF